jgi:hypothetical protein
MYTRLRYTYLCTLDSDIHIYVHSTQIYIFITYLRTLDSDIHIYYIFMYTRLRYTYLLLFYVHSAQIYIFMYTRLRYTYLCTLDSDIHTYVHRTGTHMWRLVNRFYHPIKMLVNYYLSLSMLVYCPCLCCHSCL